MTEKKHLALSASFFAPVRPFGAAYQYSFSLTVHLQITGKEVYWGIKVSLHSPNAGGSEFTSEVIGIEAEYWDERAKELELEKSK